MQNAAFRAAGLDWEYEILDVAPEALPGALAELRQPVWAGANVTIPHKVAVIRLLDRLEADATRVGAVNTIWKHGEDLVGGNTDLHGLRSAMACVGLDPEAEGAGLQVVILGAGGSARAAAAAFFRAQPTFVVRRLGAVPVPGAKALAFSDPAAQGAIQAADVLVNATPIGRDPGQDPTLPLPRRAVIDLVYRPGPTRLVADATAQGLATCDGWEILLAQGARSFEIWTGLTAPVAAMRKALGRN